MIAWKRVLSVALCLCLLCGLLPTTAWAVEAGSTQTNEWVSGTTIKAKKTGATTFNIMGVDGDVTYQTTYQNQGFETDVNVDNERNVRKNPSSRLAAGLRLDVDLAVSDVNSSYIMVQYTLTNKSAKSHTITVGSSANTVIDGNSRSPVWAMETNGDTLMVSGAPENGHALKLIATTCTGLWYGAYNQRHLLGFTNMRGRSPDNVYKDDSAIAYSWKVTIAPGETWTRYVLIGTGSEEQLGTGVPVIIKPLDGVPEPYVRLNKKRLYFNEGDTITALQWNNYVAAYEGTLNCTGYPRTGAAPGTYTVTYTATNDRGTVKAELPVYILPKAAALSQTMAKVSNGAVYALSATMTQAGGVTWTETGFVYGALQNPTLELNDGKVKTSTAVSTNGGALSAKTTALTAGLTYYARAYATAADGTVLYGPQSAGFGPAVPSYGAFTVINNGDNTFTITRIGGTDGVQTVYYRTVNGSAIGGTHFTHNAGSLTFAAGKASQTITITENAVTTPYESSNHTVDSSNTPYSNANRTYQLEIYRVSGGAVIDPAGSTATRTMKRDENYVIASKIFDGFSATSIANNDNSIYEHGDYDVDRLGWNEGGKLGADHGTEYKNTYTFKRVSYITETVPWATWENSEYVMTYLKGLAKARLQFRTRFFADEGEDGYQHIQITPGESIDTSQYPYSGSWKYNTSNKKAAKACYSAIFEHGGNGREGSSWTHYFPYSSNTSQKENVKEEKFFNDGDINGKDSVSMPADTTHVTIGLTASGSKSDKWHSDNHKSKYRIEDMRGPWIINAVLMGDTTYRPGDTVTISMIFDEIIDKSNSQAAGLSSATSIIVEWTEKSSTKKPTTEFYYAGGAGTNVLYFTGTVPEDASGPYSLWTEVRPAYATCFRDMGNNPAVDAVNGTGFFILPIKISSAGKPGVTIASLTNASGTLTGTFGASYANKLEYAWTDSSDLPAYGWRSLNGSNSGSVTRTVTTRQTAGTWYLHVRAINEDGLVYTTCKSVTIQTGGSSAYAPPELTVSADNTAWAKTRDIAVTHSPSNATVEVKAPDGSTATVSGSAYTAKANGVYTFTLTSGSEKITRQAVVTNLDTDAPVITIQELPSSAYTERIALTFFVDDGDSGVKTVTAKWGGVTVTATKNSDGTYTAVWPDVTTKSTRTLTVTATDNVGNSASKTSNSYTVDLKAPTLTVTKTSENAQGETYGYFVNDNGNTGITVHLPDGAETAALTGSFTLAEPGTYPVIVTDEAGHFVSKDVTVAESVDGIAPDVRLYPNETAEGGLIVDVSVYETGGALTVQKDGSALAVTDKGSGIYTGAFTVTEGDTYTVTATDKADNVGTASIIVYALVDGDSTVLKSADNGTYGKLPTPTRTDYSFVGWYTADVDGTRVDDNVAIGTNYTLYARWTHDNHTNSAAVRENEIPATCTEGGSYDEVVYCTVCKAEIIRTHKTSNALGHDYSVSLGDVTPATCTEGGKQADMKCSRCDGVKTGAVIPASGHTNSAVVKENDKAATCTESGSYDEVVYCTVCHVEISRVQKAIDALDHDVVHHDAKAPVCTEKGWKTYDTCKRCDYTTYKEIPALDHDWSEWVETRPATEDADGVKTRTCKRDPSHKETASIPKLEHTHSMTHHDAAAATCTETGNVEYWSCSKCGKNFGDSAGTKPLTTVQIAIAPSNHKAAAAWMQENGKHYRICENGCGTHLDEAACSGGTATCRKRAVCSVCDKEYGALANHDFASAWSKDDSSHWHKCQTESCAEKCDFAAHIPDHSGNATEEYPILCTECGYEMEPQLSHTHIYDQEKATDTYKKSDATCTSQATYYKSCACGAKGTETFAYGEFAPHSYTNAADKEDALKAAGTCKDKAVYYYSCSVCGAIERDDAHTFTGEKNAENHAGGKETRNEVEPNHKTQTSGYSGDIYCLGCGEKLSSGIEVLPSPHVQSTEWRKSETEHWKICSVGDCGEVLESTRASHSYDDDVDQDCNTCGYVRTSVHTCGNATLVNGQAPGCTTDGWEDYYQCSCGKLYTTEDCTTLIAGLEAWKTGDGKLAALGHEFTVQKYDDTQHWKKCSRCDATGVKEAHTGGMATCQARAVCDVCDQPYGDYADHDFDTSTWGYQDADGHAHRCQTSGCTEHNTKIAHTSSGGATEDSPETCTECGYVIHAALGHTHNWAPVAEVPATCIHTGTAAHYKCSCNQLAIEESGSYVYVNSDDTRLVTPINADNHAGTPSDWQKNAGKHWKIYSCCHAVIAEAPHSGGTATCQVKAICAICGQTYGELGAHNYDTSAWGYKDADGHAHLCQTADCTVHDVLAAHSYDDDSDTTCNVCNYIRSITPHSHDLRVVPAIPVTCSSVGNIKHYRCEECGRLFNDSNGTQELTAADVTIGKLSHTLETIPAVPATCEQSGLTEGSKCSVCQEVITEQTTIPALNHNWQPATCETPKTCTRCHATQGKAPGHNWGRYTVTTPATETSEGVETRTCARNSNHTQTRAIPKLPARTYGVSGEVHENGGRPAEGVKVMLVLGDRQIASTTTNSDGKYSFMGVVPGVYNLVAEKGGVTMTVKVEVVSTNVEVGTITMPQGNTSSVVEVKSDDAAENVEAVVGNLEKVFEESGNGKPFTNEDKSEVDQGGSVEIKLTVTKKDTKTTSDEIQQKVPDDANVGLRLMLEVTKTVTAADGSAESKQVTDTDILLETIIRLPAALQGKDSYTVYRLHGTEVQKLTTAKNDNGEFIEVSSDKTTIIIYAKLYSEYVIAYQESSGGNGGNGGSGGGGGSYTPSTPSNVPDKTEGNTDYRACLKDDTCPIWPFTDAVTTAWYHDGVHYCLENGLMQGVSTARFLPDGSTTRAQLVTILWRLEGSPETTGAVSFGDVADGAWYAKAVRWAAGSGVVKGYDSEHFGPDDAVTREQMVTILYRYAQYKGADVSVGEDTNILSFADAMTVSEYAIPAMQWACGSGMVNGIAQDGGMFLAPKDTTTRAQVATLMMRFPGTFAKEA